ncbi:hypothetical protein [Actinopolyspora mortivallis]|uniref:Uncharacterized protein n=1 Tax=Actinopolyspora mortivallis TaxID=33906 RepID=A0A2T0GSI4_ACTMO|nr:hypothetical protein [Actinopolyspora mortivallis]PRW62076.1 hypothetical protein CEP50_17455 [Actinopolyspora mortivallis]
MADHALVRTASELAASPHLACARFRGTDPLVVGRTRRQLAAELGAPDDAGGIPQARWTRAVTFARLVRDARFARRMVTTTLGALGMDRPTEVVTTDANGDAAETAGLLAHAHTRATSHGAATLLHGLALPLSEPADERAPHVIPDFAVVAADSGGGSRLLVGAAKDYERLRSHIDDARLLKGFLQVAAAAESVEARLRLPNGMSLHSHGVLAVPRDAFLRPEALVEALDDHRAEVRTRLEQRRRESARIPPVTSENLSGHVAGLRADFDPETCPTCPLFSYCRDELRTSTEPTDLLVELGVPSEARPRLVGLVRGAGEAGATPASLVDTVAATLEGVARHTGQRRVDQAGQPGTVNVVLAKSDSAALGVHGIATQRVTSGGREPWESTVFDEPQSPRTRREVMRLLGRELSAATAERHEAGGDTPDPVHLVVPDQPTADVLVSIADNLAGVELSRLRWERDVRMGREPLTFDGEPAEIPPPLEEPARTAVSFLLEEDRARALALRSPVVDLRAVLARHVVAGGPVVASGRLDYLVIWSESTVDGPVKPREIEDAVEACPHTPGARLTNRISDALHEALADVDTREGPGSRYAELVTEELGYKRDVLDRALDFLAAVPDSRVREVHREIERAAQAVWRRRLALHASDLVRFGRTHRSWRNRLVSAVERDGTCRDRLLALANPRVAEELATDAGTRELAVATVVSLGPLVLDVDSRRIGDGSRIVLLHVNGTAQVEAPGVELTVQKSNVRFSGMSIGTLAGVGDGSPGRFTWTPRTVAELAVGDQLVVADFAWFSGNTGSRFLPVDRPPVDDCSAPTPACEPHSHAEDPEAHEHCCRPHEDVEAERSDRLAERRARGELDPRVWPPLTDSDALEVPAAETPEREATPGTVTAPPEHMTVDDLE